MEFSFEAFSERFKLKVNGDFLKLVNSNGLSLNVYTKLQLQNKR